MSTSARTPRTIVIASLCFSLQGLTTSAWSIHGICVRITVLHTCCMNTIRNVSLRREEKRPGCLHDAHLRNSVSLLLIDALQVVDL